MTHKTNFLVVIFFLITQCLIAQNKFIAVEYIVKIEEDDLMNSDANFKRMQSEVMKKANNYTFTLLINNEGSKFYDNQILSTGEGVFSDKAIFIFLSYRGVTYSFDKMVYTEVPRISPGIFVKKNQISNWSITTETKIIDNYKCYKATSINSINSGFDKEFRFPIIAWFCPDLPYSYGPNGYGGLPGLIMELQVRNGIFGLKKIMMNTDQKFSKKELDNIKTLTQSQSDSIMSREFKLK